MLALVILLLTYWLARRLIGSAWALVAALFVATSQSLLIYTARGAGLETGLFTLLVLAGSALVLTMPPSPSVPLPLGKGSAGSRRVREKVSWWRWFVVGLMFALATLTRPEGALVMALTVAYLAWSAVSSRQSAVKFSWPSIFRHSSCAIRQIIPLLIGYLIIFLPYFVWRYSYYGDWLPNTFYAKTGGGLHQAVRGLDYAGEFALAFGGPLLLLAFMPTIRNVLFHKATKARRLAA